MKKMNHLNLTLNHSRNEKQEKETKNFQNAHSDPPPPHWNFQRYIYLCIYFFSTFSPHPHPKVCMRATPSHNDNL